MKIYLLKDIEKIGLVGEVLKVKDGFAQNFLIPQKLALEVTSANEHLFAKKAIEVKNRKQVIESKTSMLAQKIGMLKLEIKRKSHDSQKLYGSIGEQEVADLLALEGVKVSKAQIIFDKSIKELGSYDITVKLSNTLKPKCVLKVVAE
jgi:large subunit ribosomal protein L9